MNRRPYILESTLVAIACASHPVYAAQAAKLSVISSRPDAVSGGAALVEAQVPDDGSWGVYLDGHEVSREFLPAEDSGALLALLRGLPLGKSVLEIRVDGTVRSTLKIVNHPLSGPIFSGPRQRPFICQTVANGLGPPLDSSCNAKPVIQYYYRSSEPTPSLDAAVGAAPGTLNPGFKPYSTLGPRPSDVAHTLTTEGRSIPYIVRREVGVINRAVYDIEFLDEPGQPLPTPWTRRTAGWNGRLIYRFGEDCDAGYRQGTLGAVGTLLLGQGYAVATSTFNIPGNNCNDKLSAETLSMVKEHFIKEYGPPIHTIGWGGSGGAVHAHLTAQNFPGLLNGLIVIASFPDVLTFTESSNDCALLDQAFNRSQFSWTEEQKTAVSGFATWPMCLKAGDTLPYRSSDQVPWVDPEHFCNSIIPKKMIYDRLANPRGARCNIYDNAINVYGRNPLTGFARQPLDNVGVQYGLVAFNSGKIDAQRFIELNERTGGYDEDGHIIAARTQADPQALRIAYQRGLVLTGGGGLSSTPIIDWRWYSEDQGDTHDRLRSFVTRARLIAANGNADNQIMLVDPSPGTGTAQHMATWEAVIEERKRDLVGQMDRWLDHVDADTAEGTTSAKVARNKPSDLADACWTAAGEKIIEPAAYEPTGRCNRLYPSHANPRLAAGAPLTDDVLKCVLKPITPADYGWPLSAEQLGRLRALFPTGVCDYSRPGVGQRVAVATWQRFGS